MVRRRSAHAVCPSLHASWSAVRAAIAAKTQSLGGDLAEDHGALYARRRPIAKDFERIGPAWKRREGLVGTVKRADELWVKRTLTLSRKFRSLSSCLSALFYTSLRLP